MKLFALVLIISVAAIYSLPLGENSESEKSNAPSSVETEITENVEDDVNDLIREKRQFGGKVD